MEVKCPTCDRFYTSNREPFCGDCGTRLPRVTPHPLDGTSTAWPREGIAGTRASAGARIGGFAIDFAILILILPIFGAIPFLYPLAVTAYLLFRDSNGASIGKLLVGCRVVSNSGAPATAKQLILRNLIFVLGDIAALLPVVIIPWLGALVDSVGVGAMAFIELICLLITGQRLGDKMAGTMVVKRR